MSSCQKCGIERSFNEVEGVFLCEQCGEVEDALMSYDGNYTPPPKPKGIYKKRNYMRQKLREAQNQSSKQVPDKLLSIVTAELLVRGVLPKECTQKHIYNINKNKKFTHDYDKQIFYHLTQTLPEKLSLHTEDLIMKKFDEAVSVFSKLKPTLGRNNFLNYEYVLHKICQLEGAQKLAKTFPLLKSKARLRLQDTVWERICQCLHWTFYSSF